MAENAEKSLDSFIKDYIDNVQLGFEKRWEAVKPDIYDNWVHECIGALLSRQATLTIEMVKAPSIWNAHVAPLFLRCQIDAYISLGWVLADPLQRCKKFVLYGLGQEKLFIEFLEEALQEESEPSDAEQLNKLIKIRKEWLNGQLADWATEVNVGAWSGMTAREMAKEIGRESIYKHAYVPFSGVAHNMWQHIGIFNTTPCTNPMHKWHLVPKIHKIPIEPDFMYRSAKYASISFEIFDKSMDISCDIPLPVKFFGNHPFFSNKNNEGN